MTNAVGQRSTQGTEGSGDRLHRCANFSYYLAAFALSFSGEFEIKLDRRDGHHVIATFSTAQAIPDRLHFRNFEEQVLGGVG